MVRPLTTERRTKMPRNKLPIYKDGDGSWRVLFRYRDWQGKTHQTQKRGFKTLSDAKKWLKENLMKNAFDRRMTFGSFVEIYITDMQDRIRKNTWRSKDHILRTKIRRISSIYPSSSMIFNIISYKSNSMMAGFRDFNLTTSLRTANSSCGW